MKVLSIVSGFITNSSSVIHGFDASILEDERVQALLGKYGVSQGFVGQDVWRRGYCSSLLVTPEQKAEVTTQFRESEFGGGDPMFEANRVYVIYGDEYDGLAQEINRIMRDISEEKGLKYTDRDYN